MSLFGPAATLLAAVILLPASTTGLTAQQLPAVDTTGILRAVATAWKTTFSSDSASRAADPWFVRSGDSLTLRFAALIEHPANEVPTGLRCPSGTPAAAGSGILTRVEFHSVTSEKVLVAVSDSCTYEWAGSTRVFFEVVLFDVGRRDGAWVARYAGSSISAGPQSLDTTAVLAAVARAWKSTSALAGWTNPADAWFVRPTDSLTLRFAALIEQPTKPVPAGMLCSSGAPPGAVTGTVSYVEFSSVTPQRMVVSVARSCGRAFPIGPGAFYFAHHFEVYRPGATWVARYLGAEIS